MGFLDKAKQMAEQAQQKIEDTQQQFNASQAAKSQTDVSGGPRYDANGRPIADGPPTAQPAAPEGEHPASDPATAQGVGQPQPPAAAEPIEDQPTSAVEPVEGTEPVQAPPARDGVNSSPDPFKPIG